MFIDTVTTKNKFPEARIAADSNQPLRRFAVEPGLLGHFGVYQHSASPSQGVRGILLARGHPQRGSEEPPLPLIERRRYNFGTIYPFWRLPVYR